MELDQVGVSVLYRVRRHLHWLFETVGRQFLSLSVLRVSRSLSMWRIERLLRTSSLSYGCSSVSFFVSFLFLFFFDRKLGFKNSFQTLFSNVVLCMDADRVLLIVFVLGARVSFGTRYWSERIVLFITRCGVVWISLLVIHTNGVGRRKRWTLRRSCGRWLMWIFGIRFMDSLPYTVDNLCYVFSEYDYVLVLVCLLSQEHVRRL